MVDANITTNGWFTGGLVGCNYGGTITNCSVVGNVAAQAVLGCLVGRNSGTIENSHAVGTITSSLGVEGWLIGGLVGDDYGYVYGPGIITNCHAEVNVSGADTIGGLVGYNEGGTIEFCHATGNVSSDWFVCGGLVGVNRSGGTNPAIYSGSIQNCYATGNVSSSGPGNAGGLIGRNSDSIVAYCYATGDVNHTAGGGSAYIGGLIGENEGEISAVVNCYAIGKVTSSGGFTGGLVGGITSGDVINCYSVGKVTSGGGLVGWNDGGNIIASFWDIQTSGQTASAGGIGKTTIVLETKSFYINAGWDFETVWDINDGVAYPRLLWQQSQPPELIPGDVTGDGKVDFADFAIVAEHWLEGT